MNYPAIRQRIIVALFIAQGLFTAVIIVTFTLSPIIAADLGGRDGAAGLPSTITLLGRAVVAYPAGWLMDRIGRRLGLSLGFVLGICGAIVSVVAVLQGSLMAFLVGALLLGGLRGIVEQGRYVAAEVYPLAQRGRAIGLVVFAGTVGAIGGPLLAAPSEQWMLRREMPGGAGPFVVGALLLAVALLIIYLLLRPDPLQVGRELEAGEDLLGSSPGRELPLATVLRRPAIRLSIIVMGLSQLVMVMLMVMTPVYMDHHDHGTSVISWVIMAHTLGMFGLSGLSGWFVSRVGRRPMIAAGTLLLVAASIMTPLVIGVPLLALALFLLGLGWNICYVAGSALLSDAISAGERGRVQGASEAVVALASGLGSVGAGVLFEHSGMYLLGVTGLTLCLVLLVVTVFSALPGRMTAYTP